jgi:hypothetical protein
MYQFTFVLVGKQRNEKYILSLSLILVKAGIYDFPHSCDSHQNNCLFLKFPSVDIEFNSAVSGDNVALKNLGLFRLPSSDYKYFYFYRSKAKVSRIMDLPWIVGCRKQGQMQ